MKTFNFIIQINFATKFSDFTDIFDWLINNPAESIDSLCFLENALMILTGRLHLYATELICS